MLAWLTTLLAATDDTGEKLAIGGGSSLLTLMLAQLYQWLTRQRAEEPEREPPRTTLAAASPAIGERLAVSETLIDVLSNRLDAYEASVQERFDTMERYVRGQFEHYTDKLDRIVERK